jgi:hypothetical protein
MATNNPALFNCQQFNAALFGGAGVSGRVVQAGSGLLYPALRKANITIGPQRTPSPAQFQDAIEELNRLTGSLNCDRLFIYSMTNYVFPLTGQKTYTIGQDPSGGGGCGGTGADFAVPRPQVIESANIVTGNGALRYPLAIVTDLQWARIRMQDLPNTIPEILYNDRAYPLSTLYLYGQPMAGYQLELFVWTLVPQFVALTDVVLLPPGYEDALVLNLACRLAPHFQRVVAQDVLQQARESLMRLMSINGPKPIADLSGGLGCGCHGYNIYSDQ